MEEELKKEQDITRVYICKHIYDSHQNGHVEEMILVCRECQLTMKVTIEKVYI